jgi:uncharacterized membrane protein YphA (DoxX/SURF4 family)
MNFISTLDRFYSNAKQNRWFLYFTIFCRIALAAGFLPAGYVKITGERFTSLSSNQPMGHYLQALFETGYYYTFIGIAQIIAGLLLLIPRTSTLGALIYFPIILNICILSLSVRFDGSLLTSPLMVLANLYLLCWDYDKLKYIIAKRPPRKQKLSNRFPFLFFAGVIVAILSVGFTVTNIYDVKPRNSISDCKKQFKNKDKATQKAGYHFCDCIHEKGEPLGKSLDEYDKNIKTTSKK